MIMSFNNNENRIYLLLNDDVGGLRFRSYARSHVRSNNHRSRDYDVTIAFFLA